MTVTELIEILKNYKEESNAGSYTVLFLDAEALDTRGLKVEDVVLYDKDGIVLIR